MATLFSNVETLMNVNKQMLRDLDKRMRHSNVTQIIGDIFQQMVIVTTP